MKQFRLLMVGLTLLLWASGVWAAASLTVATAYTNTTGTQLTLNISGFVTLPLLPTSAITGFTVSVNGSNDVITAATSVNGVVTLTLTTAVTAGQTVTFSYTPGNLTDSAGTPNTTGTITAQAVSNNAGASQTKYNIENALGLVSINGYWVRTNFGTLGSGIAVAASQIAQNSGVNDVAEFTANCTQAEWGTYQPNSGNWCFVSVDGGAWTTCTPAVGNSQYLCLATGLTAGNHLFRIYYTSTQNCYLQAIRITGGTGTITSVARTQAMYVDSLLSQAQNGGASPLTKLGGYTSSATTLLPGANYGGFTTDFQFTGIGADILWTTIGGNGSFSATSIDGGYDKFIASGLNGSSGNVTQSVVASNIAAGSHTLRNTLLGMGAGGNIISAVIHNGTRLASSAAIGDTSINVESASGITVGDWIALDVFPNIEYVRVTSVSGTTLGVSLTFSGTTALAAAHIATANVEPYDAPAYPIVKWQDVAATKRVVFMGDSNTQGFNYYGFTGVADANGQFYTTYDVRASYAYKVCKALGYEMVNLGVQGTDSNNQSGRKVDIANNSRNAFDYLVIWEGVNDINSGTSTDATFNTNVRAQIDAARPYLRSGGKIILMPPQTPQSRNGSGGANIYSYANLLAAIAQDPNYRSIVVYAADVFAGVNLTVYNATFNPTGQIDGALHYRPSGHDQLAINLQKYLLPAYTQRRTNGFKAGSRSLSDN